MSSLLLATIADRLSQVSTDIDELEQVNKDNLQNIYLDTGDINVANETLEKLLGGDVSKSNFVYGLNSLVTSSNSKLDSLISANHTDVVAVNTSITSSNSKLDSLISANHTDLVEIDSSIDTVNTSIGSTNTKLDIIDTVLDNLLVDTGAMKASLDALDNTVSSNILQVDLNDISTIATESTISSINSELQSVDTHLANIEYQSGSDYYIKTKNLDTLADGSTAPSNTPFVPIGGVDSSGNAQVLKTDTNGNLNISVDGAVITDTVRLLSGQSGGTYPQIGNVGLVAGTASIGTVGLNAGSNAIGTVGVTSMPTTTVTNSALTELGDAINSNKVDVNLTNASVAVTGTVTSTPSGTQTISNSALTELGDAINSNKVDVNLTNTSVPVTGTFWQTTQPVSGTVEVIQDTSADLKVTEANSSDILTKATSIVTNTGSINSSIGSTNSKLDDVEDSIDSIRGSGSNLSSLYDLKGVLDTIQSNTDTLEVKVAEVDVNTDGLETLQTSTNTKLDSTISAVEKIDDVHGTDGSTAPTKGVLIGGKDGSGNFQDISMDTSGRANVNINGTVPVSGTVTATPSGTQTVSGTVTANVGTGTQAVSHGGLTELESAINSNKLDINIASGGFDGAVTGTFWQATQPVSGTVTETNSSAIKTAVEKIDNAISGSEMQVDVVTMPTTAVTGTFWQTTQPVSGTVAVTNAGLTELENAISGNEMQVDVVTMPTITETNSSDIKTSTDAIRGSGSNVKDLYDIELSTNLIRGSGANSANYKNLNDLHGVLSTINTSVGTSATNSANLSNISTESSNIATSVGAINSDSTSSKNSLIDIDTAVTVGSSFTNGSATIGTSSAQMTSSSFSCNKGVTVTADMSNSGTIFVGNSTGVTTSTGFALEAGDALFLPIDNPTKVYVISDTASQKVLYVAV